MHCEYGFPWGKTVLTRGRFSAARKRASTPVCSRNRLTKNRAQRRRTGGVPDFAAGENDGLGAEVVLGAALFEAREFALKHGRFEHVAPTARGVILFTAIG